jgi:hypothetical protein
VDLDLLILVVHCCLPWLWPGATDGRAAAEGFYLDKSKVRRVGHSAEGGRPSGPRASDADRDRFASELHEHFAEGRLSLDELQRRLDLVFAAETLVDLYELTSDLPHPGPKLSSQKGAFARRRMTRKPGWWPFR